MLPATAVRAKKAGLQVYRLDGSLAHSFPATPSADGTPVGRDNNVDVVRDVRIGTRVLDVAIVSDRGRDGSARSPSTRASRAVR